MREVFICDAARTPIGRYGGALAKVRTDDLAAVPIKALVARNAKADWSRLDDVYFGCANQAGEDNRNVARMALLLAGLPDSIGGVTLNRLCASGLEATGAAARAIRAGEMDLAIAGGVESMTRAPFGIKCHRRRRAGDRLWQSRICHSRRRRIDDTRALRHGQVRRGVFTLRRSLRHHARLALHQSAAQSAIRHRLHGRDR